MIVTIDGPAGAGKSTVARAVANRCGMTYLDTGAMYRAVTDRCISLGIADIDGHEVDADGAARIAQDIDIRFDDGGETVYANGVDVTAAIRETWVEGLVSEVSAIPAVRDAMVGLQHDIAEGHDVVAEGRDTGTTVFPDADVKVYLTADPRVRAHRRAVQRAGGNAATGDVKVNAVIEANVLDDLIRRDRYDSTREASPLAFPDGAVCIDSSTHTFDEVVDRIVALVDAACAKGAGPRDDRYFGGRVTAFAAPSINDGKKMQRVKLLEEAAEAFAAAEDYETYRHLDGVDPSVLRTMREALVDELADTVQAAANLASAYCVFPDELDQGLTRCHDRNVSRGRIIEGSGNAR